MVINFAWYLHRFFLKLQVIRYDLYNWMFYKPNQKLISFQFFLHQWIFLTIQLEQGQGEYRLIKLSFSLGNRSNRNFFLIWIYVRYLILKQNKVNILVLNEVLYLRRYHPWDIKLKWLLLLFVLHELIFDSHFNWTMRNRILDMEQNAINVKILC